MNASDTVRPPKVIAWFVELFASPAEAEGILGDLAEEFTTTVAHEGQTAARRHYRRHAWRTTRDLALAPWTTPSASRELSARGVLFSLVLGLVGLASTWPIGWALYAGARELVVRYDVYSVVPASVFWTSQSYLGSVLSGIAIALLARSIRLRPMSVALSVLVVFALVLALDRPIMVLLYGQPGATWAQVTLFSRLTRLGFGLLMFGAPLLVGVVVGRKLPLQSTRLRPTSS